MSKTLIVGFGRAGRDLHLRCLLKARPSACADARGGAAIGIVEPEPSRRGAFDACPVQVFSDLAEARGAFGPSTVVHVCTPPATHVSVVREAAQHGYRNIIVEKPLVDRLTDLTEIRALAAEQELQIFVVANWLHSSLTRRLKALVAGEGGRWSRIVISQLKPRFSHTLSSRSHETAFDVEIPHQVALSLFLAGPDARVRTAECRAMRVSGTDVPHMGAATITLEDTACRTLVLHSDLTAPIRQRSVEVTFDDGRTITGYYPASETDSFSQLFTAGGTGAEREVFADDPLSTFFGEIYDYFDGSAPRPVSDVEFNACVVSTISRAKALCGLQH